MELLKLLYAFLVLFVVCQMMLNCIKAAILTYLIRQGNLVKSIIEDRNSYQIAHLFWLFVLILMLLLHPWR